MNLQAFPLLTDENVDEEVLLFLRSLGFDVFDIKEAGFFRMRDEDILAKAFAEGRVVVTQDSDFGTLVFRDQSAFFGIVYLRPGHESPDTHIQSFGAILNVDTELTTPFIIVAENLGNKVKVRVRLF
jgi:predicted nuclease of predicted toxin-antitoxin system